MSQPTEQQPPSPTGIPPADTKTDNVGMLRGLIREEMKGIIPELKSLFGGKGDTPTQPTQQDDPERLKGEVAAVVAQIKRREEREARDKKIDALLEAQKEGTPAPPVVPKEVSRVHRFMGWGE